MWGLLSGIVEEGETSEEAVIREVREECGLEAVEPTYVGSDHIKGQLLLCFCARLVGDRPIPSSDADEVALDWPDPERIPQGVPARRLLERYMAKLPDGFWGGSDERYFRAGRRCVRTRKPTALKADEPLHPLMEGYSCMKWERSGAVIGWMLRGGAVSRWAMKTAISYRRFLNCWAMNSLHSNYLMSTLTHSGIV